MDDVKKVFQDVFDKQKWGQGESVSGTGSSKKVTAELITQLVELIAERRVLSVVDAPCGDFNWIAPVARAVDGYIGFDIVPDVVDRAMANAAKEDLQHASFEVGNIVSDALPKADLYLVRDCIVHLSFDQGIQALGNVFPRARLLLMTTFPDLQENKDVQTGRWRPLNLQLPPFNLPPPLKLIVERPNTAPHKQWGRKCLGLWSGK